MLDIDLEFIKGILFIRLKGVLDSNTYAKIDDCLYSMIYEKMIKYFAINISELDYIDMNGLKTIIKRYLDIISNDGRLIICGYHNQIDNPSVKKIFKTIEHTNSELKVVDLINI